MFSYCWLFSYFPGLLGVGQIQIKDHLSPAEAGIGAELGKKEQGNQSSWITKIIITQVCGLLNQIKIKPTQFPTRDELGQNYWASILDSAVMEFEVHWKLKKICDFPYIKNKQKYFARYDSSECFSIIPRWSNCPTMWSWLLIIH